MAEEALGPGFLQLDKLVDFEYLESLKAFFGFSLFNLRKKHPEFT
jgi:hypothetical protein